MSNLRLAAATLLLCACAVAAPSKKAASASKKAAAASKDQLSALMLSSRWCYFSYNKISGATHQEKVTFRADGTWNSGARAETYSSGANGSYAGQRDSGGGGRWAVRGGRLFMAPGAEALEDIGLEVSRNSNGYPILKALGKEYSQCR